MKSYREEIRLRQVHCDMSGLWRPSAILEAMQETAAEHCTRLGIGRPVLDARGVTWVLSRAHVELERVPRLGERVTVETCPLPLKHLFYPRVNVFYDGEGKRVGAANSLWVLIDVATRRIVNDDFVLERLPDNSDVAAPCAQPATVRPLPGEAEIFAFAPQFTDLDMNGHVNNARYMDWCCNALGVEALSRRAIAAFDVNYDAEVLPGAQLEAALTRADDRFTFTGSADGKRRFAIGGVLRAL